MGGIFKVVGDTAQLMIPLIVKAIINFSRDKEAAKAAGQPEPGIGNGVGMAIGLLCCIILQSLCTHQVSENPAESQKGRGGQGC